MRESEFCIPTSNKAVISITPNWYDRRALDTKSNYALYSSLSHLANLCQSSPKVRESLVCDGGLEQLMRILKQGKLHPIPEQFQLSKWQQALLCVVNVGVRGSELVRNRLIQAGVVPVIVTILCNALEHIIIHRTSHGLLRPEQRSKHGNLLSSSIATTHAEPIEAQPYAISTNQTHDEADGRVSGVQQGHTPSRDQQISSPRNSSGHESGSSISARQARHSMVAFLDPTSNDSDEAISVLDSNNGVSVIVEDDSDFTLEPHVERTTQAVSVAPAQDVLQSPGFTSMDDSNGATRRLGQLNLDDEVQVLSSPHRPPTTWDQDVTLCLRLLAYLSKYPNLRSEFSNSHDIPRLRQNLKQFEIHYRTSANAVYEQMDDDLSDSLRLPCNAFQLVEKFTMRIHAQESTYWAGVIMRNSCRRHDQGGIRQCAHLDCGVWETQNRQFAKCRRCRRTKYCSKACQSKAWIGHRYWCSSTHASAAIGASTKVNES